MLVPSLFWSLVKNIHRPLEAIIEAHMALYKQEVTVSCIPHFTYFTL